MAFVDQGRAINEHTCRPALNLATKDLRGTGGSVYSSATSIHKGRMRILIIGSGGREHALGHFLAESKQAPDLFFAPGNAGTDRLGSNVTIPPTDIEALAEFARSNGIDLTIVGPEVPLVHGLVDRFEAENLPVVGPTAAAARLEGSKAFAKAFMDRHGIPTAAHRTFVRDQLQEAHAFADETGAPIVIKASGLAAGKGAIVCATIEEAHDAIDDVLGRRTFGAAGDELVIEEFMRGEEASVFILTDGSNFQFLPTAQDHKAVGDGDTGPNTGGMGAYAPAPIMSEALLQWTERDIIRPTLEGMRAEGHPYRGILYVGLMINEDGPRVVEYNCRLGDPETQVVLALLDQDILDVFLGIANHDLDATPLRLTTGAAATVVLSSGGYPGSYSTGFPISGLDEASTMEGVIVFHAGTARDARGRVVTSGGRVLNVTAAGPDLASAISRAYAAVDVINFEGKYVRRDIGQKGLLRLGQA
jgi:phosphoribosylamine---glycine ligase